MGDGALLFTVTYLIEGFTRPRDDAWKQAIAALSLGLNGWVQQVNFIVYGVLLMLSAVGWYRFLTPGRGAIWFPVLQGISGLCLISIGVVSVLTPLHTILARVLILPGCGLFAFAQYALNAHSRGWLAYSLITGLLILIFWVVLVRHVCRSDTASWAGGAPVSRESRPLAVCTRSDALVLQTAPAHLQQYA